MVLGNVIMLLLLWLRTVRAGDCKTTRIIPAHTSLWDHGLAKTAREYISDATRAPMRSQMASASRIKSVITSGCEISARWLALISTIFAPIRLAMKRSRSGFIVRSWVETA